MLLRLSQRMMPVLAPGRAHRIITTSPESVDVEGVNTDSSTFQKPEAQAPLTLARRTLVHPRSRLADLTSPEVVEIRRRLIAMLPPRLL
jgi:hypothetical protein